MNNVVSFVQRKMKFRPKQYAALAFEKDGEMDIAEGIVTAVNGDSLVMDYNNVRGPATSMLIPFTSIVERFE